VRLPALTNRGGATQVRKGKKGWEEIDEISLVGRDEGKDMYDISLIEIHRYIKEQATSEKTSLRVELAKKRKAKPPLRTGADWREGNGPATSTISGVEGRLSEFSSDPQPCIAGYNPSKKGAERGHFNEQTWLGESLLKGGAREGEKGNPGMLAGSHYGKKDGIVQVGDLVLRASRKKNRKLSQKKREEEA